MSDSLYTDIDKHSIHEAWFALIRLVESSYDEERVLESALKHEINRGMYNARILIIREMVNSRRIKKHELFSYSKGIASCVVLAWSLFHRVNSSYRIKNIKKFKKLAKIAIKNHDEAIERGLDNVSSGI